MDSKEALERRVLAAARAKKTDSSCNVGSLGKGADGYYQGSAGGGGYYGGSGGKNKGQAGGGGSGFINTSYFPVVNGITPVTIPGNESFPKPSIVDAGNETGHTGHGAIRVTSLIPARSPTRSPIPKNIVKQRY